MTKLERRVDTPTTAALRDKAGGRKGSSYVFSLTEKQMHTAIAKAVPGSALLALAAINGAAYEPPRYSWRPVGVSQADMADSVSSR